MAYENVNLWFAKLVNGDIVTIDEVNKNNKSKYYCPMCGSELIPKAIKEDAIMSSHFAHIDKSKCSQEGMIHFWFKNKLLSKGDKFIVKTDISHEYICNEVLIEQSYTVGDKIYRPDVTIITECGIKVYFEMNYSNKKKIEEYIDIWMELGNPVVEVDVKELMNWDKDKLPEFKALFYKGKFFNVKKSSLYYKTIGKYTDEIYEGNDWNEDLKERIKKLNWFWIDVNKYKLGKVNIEHMTLLIDSIQGEDRKILLDILKKPKCILLYNDYKEHEKKSYIDRILKLAKEIESQYDNLIKITCSVNSSNSLQIYSKLNGEKEWTSIGSSWGSFNFEHDLEYINRQIKHKLNDIKYLSYFKKTLENKVLFEVINKINIDMKNIDEHYSFRISDRTRDCNKDEYYNGSLTDKYKIEFILYFEGGYSPYDRISINITKEEEIRESKEFEVIYNYFMKRINGYRKNLILLDSKILNIFNELSDFYNNNYTLQCEVLLKSENEIVLWFEENGNYKFSLNIINNTFNNWDLISRYDDSNTIYYNTVDYSKLELKNILIDAISYKIEKESRKKCKDCGEHFELKIGEIMYFKKMNFDLPRRCTKCRSIRKSNTLKGGK